MPIGTECCLSAKTGGVQVDCRQTAVGSRLVHFKGLSFWLTYCGQHRSPVDRALDFEGGRDD